MKTFLANLKHASEPTKIGGGVFSAAELHVAAILIRDMLAAFNDIAASEDAEYAAGVARAILARIEQ